MADRSDYLPAIFGQPAAQDDLYAHDYASGFYRDRIPYLLSIAASECAPAGKALEYYNRVQNRPTDYTRDVLGGLTREMLPDGTWYMVRSLHGDVEFIIVRDRVWITTRAYNAPIVRTTRDYALEAIYAAMSTREVA